MKFLLAYIHLLEQQESIAIEHTPLRSVNVARELTNKMAFSLYPTYSRRLTIVTYKMKNRVFLKPGQNLDRFLRQVTAKSVKTETSVRIVKMNQNYENGSNLGKICDNGRDAHWFISEVEVHLSVWNKMSRFVYPSQYKGKEPAGRKKTGVFFSLYHLQKGNSKQFPLQKNTSTICRLSMHEN